MEDSFGGRSGRGSFTVVFRPVDLNNYLSLKPFKALIFLTAIRLVLVKSVDRELEIGIGIGKNWSQIGLELILAVLLTSSYKSQAEISRSKVGPGSCTLTTSLEDRDADGPQTTHQETLLRTNGS